MFDELIDDARRYALRLNALVGPSRSEEAFATAGRLRRLRWLYSEVVGIENALLESAGDDHPREAVILAYVNRGVPAGADAEFSEPERIRLLGESVYYAAHRILKIIDKCQSALPGLQPLAAVGVRRVRNNLIEHANQTAGNPAATFTVSRAAGLSLRRVSHLEHERPVLDQGIHTNLKEFVEQPKAAYKQSGA